MARDVSVGTKLLFHSSFDTIQGEGPFAGQAAWFIRLAGCNLQCPMCDTEYTEGARYRPIETIADEVPKYRSLVVITGGEPFRQNIMGLVGLLLTRDYIVQVETNGRLPIQGMTPFIEGNDDFYIVVSPKTTSLDARTAKMAHAYKYVVSASAMVVGSQLPVTALGHTTSGQGLARPPVGWEGSIYVHPADEKDDEIYKLNMAAAVDLVTNMSNNGDDRYRVGLQLHKYLGKE